MKQLGLFISICILMGACVSEYEPNYENQLEGLLVVDGTITSGETIIKLSRSIAMSEKFSGKEYVNNAKLSVENDKGIVISNSQLRDSGEYVINVGELDVSSKYRLNIMIADDIYQSEYLSPLITPEIDSISWQKKGEGEPLYICVTSHDPLDQSPYYRWTYKEDWEFHARYKANAAYIPGKGIVMFDFKTSNNLYYCWGSDSSKIILLGSTEKLTENLIYQHKLIEIEPDHDKLSYLYHIDVYQALVSKDAYKYLSNLQKNISQTGSLFAPLPAEYKGNVKCVTSPEQPVIGYVDVATITHKSIYLPTSDELYEQQASSCSVIPASTFKNFSEAYASGFNILSLNVAYSEYRCVECTNSGRGTKDRPSWWPTDHY